MIEEFQYHFIECIYDFQQPSFNSLVRRSSLLILSKNAQSRWSLC